MNTALVIASVGVIIAAGLGMLTAIGWAEYKLDRNQYLDSKGQDHGRTTH